MLKDTEAAALLYNLTVGLDSVSLVEVTRELAGSRSRLLDAGGPCQVVELLAQRERILAEITESEALSRHYAALAEERGHLEREIARLEDEKQQLGREVRVLDVAASLRERWQKRKALDQQWAALEPAEKMPDGAVERFDAFTTALEKRHRCLVEIKRQWDELRTEAAGLKINQALVRNAPRVEALQEQEHWLAALETQSLELETEIGDGGDRAQGGAIAVGPWRRSLSFARAAVARGHAPPGPRLAPLPPEARRGTRSSPTGRRDRPGTRREGPVGAQRPRAQGTGRGDRSRRRAGRPIAAARAARRAPPADAPPPCRAGAADPGIDGPRDAAGGDHPGGGRDVCRRSDPGVAQAGGVHPAHVAPGRLGLALALGGLVFTAAAVVIKFLLEHSNARKLEATQRQIRMLHQQIRETREERDQLDRQLPASGPAPAQLQAAQRELAGLEELVPLDAQRQSARQEAEAAAERVAASRSRSGGCHAPLERGRRRGRSARGGLAQAGPRAGRALPSSGPLQ